jgi:hypothetical protein
LDSLKLLRERFFARVIHNSFEQWRADLGDALLFNSTAKEESARWSKSKLDYMETSNEETTTAQQAGVLEESPITSQSRIENLNVDTTSVQSMTDRLVTLTRMEGDDHGNVKLCLHDPEFDYDAWITIPGDEATKLGAFPGAKLKLTLQK